MPGYIIHLAAASLLQDPLTAQGILENETDCNAFLVSSLIPDAVQDKSLSHYRQTDDREIQIRYPEPWRFAAAYPELVKSPQGMGILFHLYTDYLFYHEFFSRHLLFCDEKGRPQVRKSMIAKTVLLDFDNKEIEGLGFFRDKYIYDDYTIFDAVLEEKYQLSYDFAPVENPGFKEVDYGELDRIKEEILYYSGESKKLSSHQTSVLRLEDLLKFIEDCPRRFLHDYPYWIS